MSCDRADPECCRTSYCWPQTPEEQNMILRSCDGGWLGFTQETEIKPAPSGSRISWWRVVTENTGRVLQPSVSFVTSDLVFTPSRPSCLQCHIIQKNLQLFTVLSGQRHRHTWKRPLFIYFRYSRVNLKTVCWPAVLINWTDWTELFCGLFLGFLVSAFPPHLRCITFVISWPISSFLRSFLSPVFLHLRLILPLVNLVLVCIEVSPPNKTPSSRLFPHSTRAFDVKDVLSSSDCSWASIKRKTAQWKEWNR